MKISIAKDFSTTPGVRYPDESEYSGLDFRNNILYPKVKEALANNEDIIVILDGTDGLGPSFLEESFGGLIRENKISYENLKKHLKLVSQEDRSLIEQIWQYIEEAHQNEKL